MGLSSDDLGTIQSEHDVLTREIQVTRHLSETAASFEAWRVLLERERKLLDPEPEPRQGRLRVAV